MPDQFQPKVDLPAIVFRSIAQRFAGEATEIAQFAATHYSFEEWLNWEAYAACLKIPGTEVYAKPSYCKLGV